jgi:LCP family protein required for cell wall assembly
LAGIKPKKGEIPQGGTASLGTFKGQHVAVVEVAEDTFLAVNEGNGWRIVGGNWPSLSVPAFYGTGPRIVAVVGSDARPGEDMATARADSIHFVGLDGAGSGGVVGLPRDSWVPIAGSGRGKVNSSLSSGGPETMMATFGNLTGLPLEGYVLTGFRGFQNLLGGVLGAVSVKVPFPINDRWAKVNLSAGRQDLDGAEALGFARARKTVPNGDFTRSAHQGMILISAAQAVQAMGMSAIPQLIELSEPHLMTSLNPEQLLTFSAMAISADLGSIANVVTPGSPGSAGSASVVYLASSVDELFADLADGRLGS